MAEALTQYKLIVLYMLDHVDFPLTNTQISNFVLDKEYTTLSYFPDKISAAIKSDVLTYFAENKMELKQEISIVADYYKTTSQEFSARCQIREKDRALVDLTITVNTKEQAEAVCSNWQKQSEEVYTYLMDLLIR